MLGFPCSSSIVNDRLSPPASCCLLIYSKSPGGSPRWIRNRNPSSNRTDQRQSEVDSKSESLIMSDRAEVLQR
ncbi:hypothetical protein GUJ93_ZPchr0011g28711 [Zizania palustris]|uniref:Uncharacterized protein n=1 Tax=Zizania palustris TaxID=103762 RepID=A0A8J5WM44_ZIZPA|nr:hypothetical protein GUJ93_ZPchr0011g28711 [Zizania palustris]